MIPNSANIFIQKKSLSYIIGILFLCLGFQNEINAQTYQEVADSLSSLYPTLVDAHEKVDLLNEISYTYRRISGDSVLKYGNIAYEQAASIDYIKGKSIAHKHIGIGHFKLSAPRDTIIFHYQKAIDLAEQIDDFYTQAACNNNIALTLYNQGKFNKAIRYFLNGIDIFDANFEEESRLKSLMIANTGVSYNRLGEYEKSFQYIERAITIAKKNEQRSILTMYLDDYGQILMRLGRLEEASIALDESLALQDKVGDLMTQAWVLNHKTGLEMQLERFDIAKKLALQATQISKEKNYTDSKIFAELNLARIALIEQQPKIAIEYISSIVKEAESVNVINYIQDARKIGVEAYKATGDYASALSSFEAYQSTADSLSSKAEMEFTADLEAKYDNKEKLNQINFLNKEKILQANWINLLLGSIVAAILGAIYILYLLRKRNQGSKIIEEKNEELQKYIDYSLQLENFAYIASHDLKTPLRTVVSFSQLLKKTAREKLDINETEYLDFIINGTKEMTSLIDDLLDYSSVQRTDLNIEKIELQNFLEEVIGKNSAFLEEEKAIINFDLQVDSINVDKLKFQQLCQNLIVNGVKFHKENEVPKLLISSEFVGNQVVISVEDNGIGIEKSYFDKIFLIFKRLNKKDDYQGTGIGLAIVKKIVDLHKGKIWLESTVGKGSTFFVAIPRNL